MWGCCDFVEGEKKEEEEEKVEEGEKERKRERKKRRKWMLWPELVFIQLQQPEVWECTHMGACMFTHMHTQRCLHIHTT